MIDTSLPKTIGNAIRISNDFEKNRIALQIKSLLWRMFYSEEITDNGEVAEDLKALNSLKNEIEKWLLEQRYK